MCTSPIKIRNHSKTYIVGVDKPYLLVPCGHCPECKKRKSNDLFVRSYFEFQYTKRVGGFAQMYTLTYSDEFLPRCTSLNIPCFSREHITNFLKRLRQRICRLYSVTNSELRYTLCCEYGGLRQRPHYHVNFFVNNSQVTPAQLKQLVRDSWSYGFISTTDINDGVVSSLSGLAYVCKYVSKDCCTYDFFESQKKYLKENLLFDELDILKKHMPFNRRSIGFGIFALSSNAKHSISYNNLKNRSISIPDYKLGFRNFALPLYYTRKLLYDAYTEFYVDFDGKKQYRTSFFLNDLGKSLKRDNIDNFLTSTNALFQSSFFSIDSNCIDFVNKRLNTNYDVLSFKKMILQGSHNFNDDFCKFALLYAPYIALDSEYRNNFDSSIDIDYYFYLSEDLTDLKLSKYLGTYNYGDTPDSLTTLNDVFLSHLLGVIKNPYYSSFVDVLNIFDYVFEYNCIKNHHKSIEFEKSALFRRYVYNF